jgi:signal transduction histidine kinase/ActR/RegA family two-component response regulator
VITASASERALIVAPQGRDAIVAMTILQESGVRGEVCVNLDELVEEVKHGAGLAILTEEAIRATDSRALRLWIKSHQPPWSDLPFIVLTRHGGGLERNPTASQLLELLGNVTFLERPFHPTTLLSVVKTSLRGRARQYECRRLNEELESRVQERTSELAAANRQLVEQIEERERVENTLRQMQRLEAVGQLTSGVAHDFNNLLTVILGNISFLDKGLAAAGVNGQLMQRLGYMRTAAQRGAKLTDQLLSFSRRQRLDPKALDLSETIGAMRDLLQSTIGGIRVETSLCHGLWPVLVDPTQLELAVLNLAINARDAMQVGGGGRLVVGTANVTRVAPLRPEEPPPGDYVAICVSDNGSGMTKDVREKAFEPFFTTKEIGRGSGLGLSQVLGFAKQSGGGVRIASELGRGTSIFIYLPRSAAVPTAERQSASIARPTAHAGGRILLVDDDSAVREVTAAMLRELGYSVIEVGSGGAALDVLAAEDTFDLLLVDFAMPGMSGGEVARHVKRLKPTLPVVLITGFAERAALAEVKDVQIIGKPFAEDELAEKVRSALGGRVEQRHAPTLAHPSVIGALVRPQ